MPISNFTFHEKEKLSSSQTRTKPISVPISSPIFPMISAWQAALASSSWMHKTSQAPMKSRRVYKAKPQGCPLISIWISLVVLVTMDPWHGQSWRIPILIWRNSSSTRLTVMRPCPLASSPVSTALLQSRQWVSTSPVCCHCSIIRILKKKRKQVLKQRQIFTSTTLISTWEHTSHRC